MDRRDVLQTPDVNPWTIKEEKRRKEGKKKEKERKEENQSHRNWCQSRN